MSTKRKKKVTRNKEATRLKIIEVAIQLFYDLGYSDVTFQHIADEAGITQPAIYVHFNNKIDLLAACSLHSAQLGRKLIDAQVDPMTSADERLKSYIKGNLLWLKRKPAEAYAVFALYYFSLNSTHMKEVFDKIHEVGLLRISALLSQGQNEKKWRFPDIPLTAESFHSLIAGELIKLLIQKKQFNLVKKQAQIFKFLMGLSQKK